MSTRLCLSFLSTSRITSVNHSNCFCVLVTQRKYICKKINMKYTIYTDWSSGGRVVKLLACGARGPGFDSRPRHSNFQRLVISCFQVKIWLKDRSIDINPQNNQPTNQQYTRKHICSENYRHVPVVTVGPN